MNLFQLLSLKLWKKKKKLKIQLEEREEDDEIRVKPLLLIQFGTPRSATTLQYEALCGAACLVFGAQEIDCIYGDFLQMNKPFERITVIKLHSRDKLEEILRLYEPDRIWMFATSRDGGNNRISTGQYLQEEFRSNVSFIQIQHFESLGRRGFYVVRDLTNTPLNLTVAQIDAVTEFARYWEILRRCCGAQMSHDYRLRLTNSSSSTLTHRSRASLQYDACEMYDVQVVEDHLIHTTLFRTCSNLDAIERLSVVDGRLNGSYCNRANALTKKRHLIFNAPEYLSVLDPDVHIDAQYRRVEYPKTNLSIPKFNNKSAFIKN